MKKYRLLHIPTATYYWRDLSSSDHWETKDSRASWLKDTVSWFGGIAPHIKDNIDGAFQFSGVVNERRECHIFEFMWIEDEETDTHSNS